MRICESIWMVLHLNVRRIVCVISVFRLCFSSRANKMRRPYLHFVSGEPTWYFTKWKRIIQQRNTIHWANVWRKKGQEESVTMAKIKTTKRCKAVSNTGSNGNFKPSCFISMLNYFKWFSCFFVSVRCGRRVFRLPGKISNINVQLIVCI